MVRVAVFSNISKSLTQLRSVTLLSLALAAAGMGGLVHAQEATEFAAGRILVMPRAGMPEHALEKILRVENGTARRLGGSGLYLVDLPRGSERAVANKLARNPHFRFAELDYKVEPALVPNDPYTGSAWHLGKIGAPAAWDSSMGSGVTIAILDSGVDGAHPDLAGRMVAGWNFYDNNANTTDVYGHGTQVAGGAAASTNNSVGVSSVSGHSNIMPIRVTSTSGTGYSSMIANGLIYAADRGVRVANISFANQPARASTVSAAQYMKDKGGLVFVAAGNSGIDEGFTPTTALIPVSATDQNDGKASWSSYGNYVSVSAPGVGIYTTTRGGGYGAASGTSFAAPVAAGVAALMMAARPSLTSTQIESILFGSTVDLGAAGRDAIYGHGRVNADAAVRAALAFADTTDRQPPSVAITSPTASSTVNGLTLVDVAASDNVRVQRVELRVNGALVATTSSAPYDFSWDTTTVANGMASLVATAWDAAGNVQSSTTVSVNVANNAAAADTAAPVVNFSGLKDGDRVSGNVAISTTASDDSGAAGITQRLYIDGALVDTETGGTLSHRWNTVKVKAGDHSLRVVATDAAGNSATRTIRVVR